MLASQCQAMNQNESEENPKWLSTQHATKHRWRCLTMYNMQSGIEQNRTNNNVKMKAEHKKMI